MEWSACTVPRRRGAGTRVCGSACCRERGWDLRPLQSLRPLRLVWLWGPSVRVSWAVLENREPLESGGYGMSSWRSYVNRRVAVGMVWLSLGCAGFLWTMFGPEEAVRSLTPERGMLLILTSIGSCLGGFGYMWLTIRCQQCGMRLFAYAATRVRTGMPFYWLETLAVCPGCGDVPGGSTDHQDREDVPIGYSEGSAPPPRSYSPGE
jgi:hypothetical protein